MYFRHRNHLFGDWYSVSSPRWHFPVTGAISPSPRDSPTPSIPTVDTRPRVSRISWILGHWAGLGRKLPFSSMNSASNKVSWRYLWRYLWRYPDFRWTCVARKLDSLPSSKHFIVTHEKPPFTWHGCCPRWPWISTWAWPVRRRTDQRDQRLPSSSVPW